MMSTKNSKTRNLQCPGCGEAEVAEVVAESGTGPLAGQAYFSCTRCGWFGNERALCHATELGDRNEILDCLAEDRRRGEPGGSSDGKGRDKKTGGSNSRPDQEASPLWGDANGRTIQDLVRDKLYAAKFTGQEALGLESAIIHSGLTKSKWIQRALVDRARQEMLEFGKIS